MKELTLLHETARLLQPGPAMDEKLLDRLARLVPPAWQYPEVCAAHIRYAGLQASTAGFRRSKWVQSCAFTTRYGVSGLVEVAYLEERPEEVEGPFLIEERRLIQSFADTLRVHAERKHAEEALASAEERFSALFESSPVGLLIAAQHDGRVVEVNGAFESVTGYPRAEAVGRTTGELGFWPEPDLRRRHLEAAARKVGPYVFDHEIESKGGSRVPVRVASRLVDLDGTSHVMSAFVDSTEQKALERQLQQARRMEAVGRLAAGVAHDFNNILSAIVMTTDLLGNALPAEGQTAGYVAEIQAAAERAAGLTRQLLAFGRQQVMEPRLLDLNAQISEVAPMLRRLAGAAVRLETRLGADAGRVRADPAQLEQVLVNLVVNARDAMPEGGTLVIETDRVEQSEAPQRSGAPQSGSYARVSVSDTGVGMDEATRRRIFEPFFTTKEPNKGTGLGLSTVYGIVGQSGGSIDVESSPGRGARFRVCLPRVEPPTNVRPPEGSGATPRGSETVLLVDDDDAVRQTARAILARLGYRVYDAAGSSEARQFAAHFAGVIDVLIVDFALPHASGRALAEALTAQRPGMVTLVTSGSHGATSGSGIEGRPGFAVVGKPFTSQLLGTALRELLDARPPAAPPGER